MKRFLLALMILIAVPLMAQEVDERSADAERMKQLTEQLKQLEEQLAALEKRLDAVETDAETVTQAVQTHQTKRYQQALASKRMKQDAEVYSPEELAEIEKVYQSGMGRWATKDGYESLKILTSKYPKANRTGCALLLTGEASRSGEREEYLKKAIADYSDCFFKDGVRVGAWGRYQLAEHYERQGESAKAKALYLEILDKYPNAVDKRARALRYSVDKRL